MATAIVVYLVRREFSNMPPAVLTLECAKKIREVLGETYETGNDWVEHYNYEQPTRKGTLVWDVYPRDETDKVDYIVPAPDFAETIRLMPKLDEKVHWGFYNEYMGDEELMRDRHVKQMAIIYMLAPTPEQGMIEISEYILKII